MTHYVCMNILILFKYTLYKGESESELTRELCNLNCLLARYRTSADTETFIKVSEIYGQSSDGYSSFFFAFPDLFQQQCHGLAWTSVAPSPN